MARLFPIVDESSLELAEGPAALLDDHFRILAANDAYIRTFAGGEPVVGRFCFEVSHGLSEPCAAHGERCPVQHVRDDHGACRVVHVHQTSEGARHHEIVAKAIAGPAGSGARYLEQLREVKIASADPRSGTLVGSSPAFQRMLELVVRVAPSPSTVLLLGESGTGKEVVARAVHAFSARAAGPFVPVDCSGLAESLFESEVFGHERGAFTSAYACKHGLIEAASGGTLFLDEIGDIPVAQQVKLLRVIETGVFRRVGSLEQRRANFRLICATHRDLTAMMEDGRFRRDLYYRISAFPVHLPPLRDRPEDVSLIAEAFLKSPACSHVRRINDEALALLRSYPFPGNVRELHNIIERACLLAEEDTILPEHLPDDVRALAAQRTGFTSDTTVEPLADVEARYLQWALARFPDDRRSLARRLAISERTLYRKLNAAARRRRQPGQ